MSWRKKFEYIIANYGHDVFLQRRIVDKGVGYHNVRSNAGFSKKLERHTVRSRLAGKSGTLPGIQEEMFEGSVDDVDKVFYFKWDVNPDKNDRIYEHEPVSREVYIIDWAQPFRGPGGQVVYWAVGASLTDREA